MSSISRRFLRATCTLLVLAACITCVQAQVRVLFDASHRENAANSDWVIDADSWDLNQEKYPCGVFEDEAHAQRVPTPDPLTIGPEDPETVWTGAISAFGIDLAKLGYHVETLPVEGEITYADGTNDQDLSLYDIFVLPEPNQPLSGAEILAIREFIFDGGGVFFIADHQTSDRDCDGFDSPHIGNELMGVVISGGQITDAGLFGIVFNVEEISSQTDADYWFTDSVDDNVTTDPTDPIIHGTHGDGSGGLGLFGSTSMTLDRVANTSALAHIWKTDTPEQGDLRVTFATSWYGLGRIACIGDSSPADDGTGDSGDTLYDGWDKASGGVNNKEIHLNSIAWLANADPDETAPARVDDLSATPQSADKVLLEWTAPGDDGSTGRANLYDIRRASAPILTATDFSAAVPLDGEPAPSSSGSLESWQATGLDPETSYWFALVTEDEAGNRAPISNSPGATTGEAGSGGGGPSADHLVISEVQTRGVSDHNDEFIELYNPTGDAVSLSGWSIQYKSASGTTYLKFDLPSDTISVDGLYLVARPEYSLAVTPDATQSVFLMGASGGHVFLVESAQTLSSCSGAPIIDKIAWGSGDCPETSTAQAHAAGEALERAPGATEPDCGNGTDTDDNSADFAIRSPADPQNSTDTEAPCGQAALGSVGPSLYLGQPSEDALTWAAAVAASTYKLRRSGNPDFMQTHPLPDDTWLHEETAQTSTTDPATPSPTQAFFYFVNAVGADGVESSD